MKKKTYPIENSPLYKLKNKRKLANLLNTDVSFISKVSSSREFYNCYSEPKKNGNGSRPIEAPYKILKIVQEKILKLLSRINTPSWLKSGKKGESYITNAAYHQDSHYFLCVDIKSFYQSASGEYVFRMFKNDYKMSQDVAWLLTGLLTIKKVDNQTTYIPTGAPPSQLLTFLVYQKTFLKLHNIANSYGAKMSLLVDDITFSSKAPLPRELLKKIRGVLREVGLTLKQSKTKKSSSSDDKLITGVIITSENNLDIPFGIRQKIKNILKALKKNETKKLLRSLFGTISSGRQIKPHFMEMLYVETKNKIKLYDK